MAEINMRQIEVFLTAAKHQNISRAASELFISQPSLSKYISKMEKDVGQRLFQRTNRGVLLTPAGEELYANLDFVYHRFRVNVEEICGWNGSASALRVGCLHRQITYDVTQEQIKAFRLRYPEAKIYLERYDAHSLRSKLLCEELDMIVTLQSEIMPEEEFDCVRVCDYPLFFIVPQSWEKDGLLGLNGKTMFIESPNQLRWSEAVCREYGITPGDVRYVNSYGMLATRIGRMQGFSVDSKMMEIPAAPQALAYLPVKWSMSGTVVLARRRRHPTEITKEFSEFIRPEKQDL